MAHPEPTNVSLPTFAGLNCRVGFVENMDSFRTAPLHLLVDGRVIHVYSVCADRHRAGHTTKHVLNAIRLKVLMF